MANLIHITLIPIQSGHNLDLYTLEPGSEKFMAFEYWISKPKMIKLRKEHKIADFYINKQIKVQSSATCLSKNSYQYFGE